MAYGKAWLKRSFDGGNIRVVQRFVLKRDEFFFNDVCTVQEMVLYVVFQILPIFNIDFPHVVLGLGPKISIKVPKEVRITIGV